MREGRGIILTKASGFKAFSSAAQLLSHGAITPLWQQQRSAYPAGRAAAKIPMWPPGAAQVSLGRSSCAHPLTSALHRGRLDEMKPICYVINLRPPALVNASSSGAGSATPRPRRPGGGAARAGACWFKSPRECPDRCLCVKALIPLNNISLSKHMLQRPPGHGSIQTQLC